MYLIDTSVWIDFFREKQNKAVQDFIEILDNSIPFSISSIIYQEILQGAVSAKDFKTLKEYLSTQRFVHPKNNLNTYQDAAELYFNCRRKGITVRSTVDCLIAQIAIEHELVLLHNDKDFINLQKIIPHLKLEGLSRSGK